MGNGFVAVNSEVYDNFDTRQSENLPWSDGDDSKAWRPYNQAVKLWWDMSHSGSARLKTIYPVGTFIFLTLDHYVLIKAHCPSSNIL